MTGRGPQASPHGRLRVETGAAVASGILIPALPGFRARYPDLHVEIGATDRNIDLIGENVDCGIRGSADDPSLINRKIGALSYTTCASPEYLARHGAPLHPRDIEDGHLVVGSASARTGRVTPLLFDRDGEHCTIEGRGPVTVNEANAHLAASLAGLGIVQTLDFILRPHIERGALVPVLTDWPRARQPIYLVYPPSRHLSTRLRVFIEWAAALFAGLH